jgi:short-subunit dehydrogenase
MEVLEVQDLRNKVAVITGASSGIGRELAVCLADQGCALALADISRENLQELAGRLSGNGHIVTTHHLDVSNRQDVYKTADLIHATYGRVDVLINCAAVAVLDTLEDITYDDFEWVMNVNFWGVVYTTKAFLPFLKQREEAHIVNISSVDGIVPNPGNGAYSATKAAVKSLTETLFQELHGTNISVTCVLPGGVKTNFHRNARFFKVACPGMTREECIDFFEKSAMTSPQTAARIIANSICRKRCRVLIGLDSQLIDFFARLMPLRTTALAGYLSRNLNTKKLDWCQKILRRLGQGS